MSTGYKKCKMGNDLEFVDELINEMLLILTEEASDDFWRILKYGETDILSNPSNYPITQQDKFEMIKQNNVTTDSEGKVTTITRVKTSKFNTDISTDAHSEIRLFNASWNISSQNYYELIIGVEIISHNKSIILDDVGKQTINVLRHEIYRIFDNSEVYRAAGTLTNVDTSGVITIFNSDYQGYQLSLSSVSA